jgi:hypothetical protein
LEAWAILHKFFKQGCCRHLFLSQRLIQNKQRNIYSWFHSMLFALPSYQFSFIVMNRYLYLSYQVMRCISNSWIKLNRIDLAQIGRDSAKMQTLKLLLKSNTTRKWVYNWQKCETKMSEVTKSAQSYEYLSIRTLFKIYVNFLSFDLRSFHRGSF